MSDGVLVGCVLVAELRRQYRSLFVFGVVAEWFESRRSLSMFSGMGSRGTRSFVVGMDELEASSATRLQWETASSSTAT